LPEFLQSELYHDWMIKLGQRTEHIDFDEEGYPIYINYLTPKDIAKIIERAFKFYKI